MWIDRLRALFDLKTDPRELVEHFLLDRGQRALGDVAQAGLQLDPGRNDPHQQDLSWSFADELGGQHPAAGPESYIAVRALSIHLLSEGS